MSQLLEPDNPADTSQLVFAQQTTRNTSELFVSQTFIFNQTAVLRKVEPVQLCILIEEVENGPDNNEEGTWPTSQLLAYVTQSQSCFISV